ncbi:MAG TPA: hypothetical protein VMI12_19295 [Puia sp.]|nr:hypothetical protein [Puia sp.]
MKKKINEVINFSNPSDIVYWSKKWEVSPLKLFTTFVKIKSNHISDIKKVLRTDGFVL